MGNSTCQLRAEVLRVAADIVGPVAQRLGRAHYFQAGTHLLRGKGVRWLLIKHKIAVCRFKLTESLRKVQ